MDFQIRITEAALTDFQEILFYSWTNFPATAENFGNAILDHVDILRSFPYIGSTVHGRSGVRLLVHTPILIYYRVHEARKLIEVLHFRHRSRRHPVF